MNDQEKLFVKLFEKHYLKNRDSKIIYRAIKMVWGNVIKVRRDYHIKEYITKKEYDKCLNALTSQISILLRILGEMEMPIDLWYPVYDEITEEKYNKWPYIMAKIIKRDLSIRRLNR